MNINSPDSDGIKIESHTERITNATQNTESHNRLKTIVSGLRSSLTNIVNTHPKIDFTPELHAFAVLQDKLGFKNDQLGTPDKLGKKWNYEVLREYLLALPRGKDFVLPKNEYPDEMELSSNWHEVLNKARRDTRIDHHERWIGVGTNADYRTLYLPILPSQGKKHYVPGELIRKGRQNMKNNGMTHIIGDIHSHPGERGHASFSLGDIYNLIYKGTQLSMIGVVEGNENIFAFRSKESDPKDADPTYMTQENFSRYWYEKNGWEFTGINKDGDTGETAVPRTKSALSQYEVMKQAAKSHNLVLYKGRAGEKLQRINLE